MIIVYALLTKSIITIQQFTMDTSTIDEHEYDNKTLAW